MSTAAGVSIGRGALLNIVGLGVPLLIGALTIPLILHRTGVELFGLLALIWAAFGYFGMFDFGLSRSTAWLVADALGRGRDQSIPRIVEISVALHLLLGSVGGIALAAATPMIVSGIFQVRPALIEDARTSFYLLSASIPVVVVAAAYRGVLEAYRRFDLVNAVKLSTGAATFVLPLVVVLLDGGMSGITAMLVLVRVGVAVMYARMCARVTNRSGPDQPFDRRTIIRLFSFGGWVTLSNLTSSILIYLDRVLIGSLVSVTAVAYYSAPYEVITRLAIIPASLAMAISPTITIMGLDRRDEIVRLLERSVRIILLIMTPVSALLVAFAQPILAVWLGPVFAQQSAGALRVLGLGMLANALAYVPYTVLQGLGRPDLTTKVQLVELPVYSLGAWFLIKTAGITGAAVAWSALLVADAILYFVLAGLMLSLPALSAACGRLLPVVLLAGVFGGVVGLVALVQTALVLKVAMAALTTAVFAWIAWARVLDGRDRDALRSVLHVGRPVAGG